MVLPMILYCGRNISPKFDICPAVLQECNLSLRTIYDQDGSTSIGRNTLPRLHQYIPSAELIKGPHGEVSRSLEYAKPSGCKDDCLACLCMKWHVSLERLKEDRETSHTHLKPYNFVKCGFI